MDEYHAVTPALAETVDTLDAHRIDEGVRVLPLATALALPFSRSAAHFGMNIGLPCGEAPKMCYPILRASFGGAGRCCDTCGASGGFN